MRMLLIAALGLGAAFLGSTSSSGWASAVPDLTEAQKETKFEGLKGLTHHSTRVYGMFVNFHNYYYHQGDTAAFQSYLDHLATFDDAVVRELRLAPGKGKIGRIGQNGPKLNFDWSLMTTHSKWFDPGDKRAAAKKNGVVLRVTLFLNGNVALGELNLPKGIQVVDQLKDA